MSGPNNGYPAYAVEIIKQLATVKAEVESACDRLNSLPCERQDAEIEELWRAVDKKAGGASVSALTAVGAALGAILLWVSRHIR